MSPPTSLSHPEASLQRPMQLQPPPPMAIEPATAAAPSPAPEAVEISPAAAAAPARRGWLRRLIPREYLPRRRWKLGAGGGVSRLAGLSRSLRWKRLPGFSLSLPSRSAAAVVDAVVFRVLYVVEAVVLGLGLSCFFLCCGCHL